VFQNCARVPAMKHLSWLLIRSYRVLVLALLPATPSPSVHFASRSASIRRDCRRGEATGAAARRGGVEYLYAERICTFCRGPWQGTEKMPQIVRRLPGMSRASLFLSTIDLA
jgi:hypothetical protein